MLLCLLNTHCMNFLHVPVPSYRILFLRNVNPKHWKYGLPSKFKAGRAEATIICPGEGNSGSQQFAHLPKTPIQCHLCYPHHPLSYSVRCWGQGRLFPFVPTLQPQPRGQGIIETSSLELDDSQGKRGWPSDWQECENFLIHRIESDKGVGSLHERWRLFNDSNSSQ